MSGNVSENVELGQLPQLQECYENGHQEDECEKEDKEEEMSLLGENDGGVCSPPVQIVVAARHSSALQSSPVQAIPNPQHVHQPRLATPDPDIQLAESECGQGSVRAVDRSDRQLSSIHSVCGPKPVKLTIICLVMLSIWAMVVLTMHLDKKVQNTSLYFLLTMHTTKISGVTSSLSYTEDKLRTMEDMASSYRHQSSERLQSIQHKLGEILHSVRTGARSEGGKTPKMPNAVQPVGSPAVSAQSVTVSTKHTTEQDKTEEEVEKDFFGDDPPSNLWPLQ